MKFFLLLYVSLILSACSTPHSIGNNKKFEGRSPQGLDEYIESEYFVSENFDNLRSGYYRAGKKGVCIVKIQKSKYSPAGSIFYTSICNNVKLDEASTYTFTCDQNLCTFSLNSFSEYTLKIGANSEFDIEQYSVNGPALWKTKKTVALNHFTFYREIEEPQFDLEESKP